MINTVVINTVIQNMCIEVSKRENSSQNWSSMEEDELLYEIALGIFGSQLVFEMAEAMVNQLRDKKLLNPMLCNNIDIMQKKIVEVFDKPLVISLSDGSQRLSRPRFKNRLALLLSTTMSNIYGGSRTIRELLLMAKNPKQAREILIQNVCGFGPKQASLFLRRIGFCIELAVLDIHILDYLNKVRGLSLSSRKLSCLAFYEETEEVFRKIANEFGHSIGCVDLAMWLTMRVAKKKDLL